MSEIRNKLKQNLWKLGRNGSLWWTATCCKRMNGNMLKEDERSDNVVRFWVSKDFRVLGWFECWSQVFNIEVNDQECYQNLRSFLPTRKERVMCNFLYSRLHFCAEMPLSLLIISNPSLVFGINSKVWSMVMREATKTVCSTGQAH